MSTKIKVVPLLSQDEFKALVPDFNPTNDMFKQAKAYQGQNGEGVIGLFESEIGKRIFFQVKAQTVEGKVRADYPGLYVLYPNPDYRAYPYEKDAAWTEKKYQIPPSEWKVVKSFEEIAEFREKRAKEPSEISAFEKAIKASIESDLPPWEESPSAVDLLKSYPNTTTTKPEPLGAVKNDSSKNKVELLPPLALEKIAKVFTFGAKKYSSWNWSKGMDYSRLYGALQRHMLAWYRGEDRDYDPNCEGCKTGTCKDHSGESHLANAGCCLLMLIEMAELRKDMDDRPKHYGK